MENTALERVVESIYTKIAETGEVTSGQLFLLKTYYKERSPNIMDLTVRYGNEFAKIVDKIFPVKGGK